MIQKNKRVIVALSGGKASAWCAFWALRNFEKKKVVFYWNDTKWEDSDLYRFIKDISFISAHPITEDSDGRSPEEIFYKERALANNRMPFCSKILKAKRLQKFYRDGDILVFGIGVNELERARRIVAIYQTIAAKTGKFCEIRFPLIEEKITAHEIDLFLKNKNLTPPRLYKKGFTHNNCGGGCVRAGKKEWIHLLRENPELYNERERVELEVSKFLGKNVHFLKNETLRELRERSKKQRNLFDKQKMEPIECIGVCDSMN